MQKLDRDVFWVKEIAIIWIRIRSTSLSAIKLSGSTSGRFIFLTSHLSKGIQSLMILLIYLSPFRQEDHECRLLGMAENSLVELARTRQKSRWGVNDKWDAHSFHLKVLFQIPMMAFSNELWYSNGQNSIFVFNIVLLTSLSLPFFEPLNDITGRSRRIFTKQQTVWSISFTF